MSVVAPTDESAIWAIGRSVAGGVPMLWPSLRTERASAAALARSILAAHGVGRDGMVMVIAMIAEGVQFVPVEDGARALGAVPVPADASRLDARRVAAFTREFRLDAIVGLSDATLSGFDDLRVDVAVLDAVPVVLARPGAAAVLRRAGREVFACVPIGPAVALECPHRSGAHLDGDTWDAVVADGDVVLRARHAVGGRPELVETGVPGRIVDDVCACGHTGPSVVVAG